MTIIGKILCIYTAVIGAIGFAFGYLINPACSDSSKGQDLLTIVIIIFALASVALLFKN